MLSSAPSSAWTTLEIRRWLRERDVDFDPSDSHLALCALACELTASGRAQTGVVLSAAVAPQPDRSLRTGRHTCHRRIIPKNEKNVFARATTEVAGPQEGYDQQLFYLLFTGLPVSGARGNPVGPESGPGILKKKQ